MVGANAAPTPSASGYYGGLTFATPPSSTNPADIFLPLVHSAGDTLKSAIGSDTQAGKI